jgi:hypothetical protein
LVLFAGAVAIRVASVCGNGTGSSARALSCRRESQIRLKNSHMAQLFGYCKKIFSRQWNKYSFSGQRFAHVFFIGTLLAIYRSIATRFRRVARQMEDPHDA